MKLRRLEELLSGIQAEEGGNPKVRELEVRSLTTLANQLREELAVFEARSAARAASR